MLVISRKKSETLVINEEIRVTVIEIRDGRVRLGIVAPQHVPVHRKEIFDLIQRNEKAVADDQATAAPTNATEAPAP